jgi:hypothetical protein
MSGRSEMGKDIDALIKVGKETDAGAVKSIARKTDGTILRIVCVYFESDDLNEEFLIALEQLEAEFGFGT